jgi:hypothetical protein
MSAVERRAVLADIDQRSQTGNIIADAVQRGRAIRLLDNSVARVPQCHAGEALRDHNRCCGGRSAIASCNGRCDGRDLDLATRGLGRGAVQAPADGGKYEQRENDTGELGTIHGRIVRKRGDHVESVT